MDESIATLQIMMTRGIGHAILRRILLGLAKDGMTRSTFVHMASSSQEPMYKVKPEILHAIAMNYDKAMRMGDEIVKQRIQLHVLGDTNYPHNLLTTLGDAAPPLLFSAGNTSLFDSPGIGFCGSRKASEKGLGLAKDTIQSLTKLNFNIVSGYANGVDLTAHSTALSTGGTTTMVLAEGIFHFDKKPEILDLFDFDRCLIVSEYLPDKPWSAGQAMQRNQTIIGLSQAMIVIESGVQGGTFAAGEATLRLRRPLFVLEFSAPEPSAEGNAVLIQRGAIPLRRNLNGPNLKPLLQTVQSVFSYDPPSLDTSTQMALF